MDFWEMIRRKRTNINSTHYMTIDSGLLDAWKRILSIRGKNSKELLEEFILNFLKDNEHYLKLVIEEDGRNQNEQKN